MEPRPRIVHLSFPAIAQRDTEVVAGAWSIGITGDVRFHAGTRYRPSEAETREVNQPARTYAPSRAA